MTKPKDEKPTAPERPKTKSHHESTCGICGLVTDLAVCPIDGNTLQGKK